MKDSIKLGRYNYSSKVTNYLKKTQTLRKDFYCNESPIMIYGENEETSKDTILALAETFISSDKGLVFCEADGDSSVFYKLYSLAYEYYRNDDVYLINCGIIPDINSKPYTYSVNLITPLIEELSLFESIADSNFAPLLQALCRCVRDHKQWVTFEHLNQFKELSYISTLFSDPVFKTAYKTLNSYLESINFFTDPTEAERDHGILIDHYESFLSHMGCYKFLLSDSPDICIDNLIKENKILIISLPELRRDTDEHYTISNLLFYHLLHKDYKDCDMGIFFDVYPFCLKKEHIASFYNTHAMDKRKIVFTAIAYYEDQNTTALEYCNSFILLNIQYGRRETYHFLNNVGRQIEDIDLYHLNKYKLTELDRLTRGEALYLCSCKESNNYKQMIPIKINLFTKKDYDLSYIDIKISRLNEQPLDQLLSYFY